jgi:hypothetical protein
VSSKTSSAAVVSSSEKFLRRKRKEIIYESDDDDDNIEEILPRECSTIEKGGYDKEKIRRETNELIEARSLVCFDILLL